MDQQDRPHGLDILHWLLSPEHAARMGGALWVFLWLWREGKPDESPHVRQVRGGVAFRLEEIAQDLGLPVRTVRRHLATLRDTGYLTTWREQHGFSAVVNLWDSAGSVEQSRLAKNGHSDSDGLRLAKIGQSEMPERPKMASLEPESAAKFGQSENPPAPPLRVLEDLRLDLDSSESCLIPQPCGFTEPPTTKTANVVPIRPGLEGQAPAAGAVAAVGPPQPSCLTPSSKLAGDPRGRPGTPGAQARRLRHEQAIVHQLSRIEAWERPELNRSLREALLAVPLARLPDVFDAAWFARRFRGGAVRNPAGWWFETLRRTARECLEAVAVDGDHEQE